MNKTISWALIAITLIALFAVSAIAPKPDHTPPTAPTNLVATATTNSIQLTWNASTDNVGVTGYELFRSSSSGGTYNLIATVTSTNYTDSNVSAGQTWFYKVRAFDAAGNRSAFSNIASAHVNSPPSISVGAGSGATDVNTSTNVNISANASDSDGTVSSINWSAASTPSGCSYVSQTNSGLGTASASSTATYSCSPGTRNVTATALDNSSASTNANGSISVNAKPLLSVTNGVGDRNMSDANGVFALVALTASASDSDGTISSIAWSNSSVPSGCSLFSTQSSGLGSANASSVGTYHCYALGTFNLIVRAYDNQSAFKDQNATVTVNNPPNNPPSLTANNGVSDRNLLDGNGASYADVTLTARASDIGGSVASIVWGAVSPPNGCSLFSQTDFGIGTSNATSFAHYYCYLVGLFTAHITTFDNLGASASVDANINIIS